MDANERLERDYLLDETDWGVIKAIENGLAVPPELRAYRQALRDLPTTFPGPVTAWPVKPAGF